jgi:hypothetical protein
MSLKIISITLFIDLVAAFSKPPMTINMFLEAACGPENSSESRLWHENLRAFFLYPRMRLSVLL